MRNFIPIDSWPVFKGNVIERLFSPDVFLGNHNFLSILNDTIQHVHS